MAALRVNAIMGETPGREHSADITRMTGFDGRRLAQFDVIGKIWGRQPCVRITVYDGKLWIVCRLVQPGEFGLHFKLNHYRFVAVSACPSDFRFYAQSICRCAASR
jgi:hypothetical protein